MPPIDSNIEWRPVPGFEDNYLVSNSGLVWSLKRKKRIKTQVYKDRYEMFNYYKKGTGRKERHLGTLLVHRLVALAFVPNPDPAILVEVNHKNGIRTDNRADNLGWVTRLANVKHSIDTGLRIDYRGQDNVMARLTDIQVREIREKYIPRKYSMERLGEEYGVSATAIFLIIRRRSWKHLN